MFGKGFGSFRNWCKRLNRQDASAWFGYLASCKNSRAAGSCSSSSHIACSKFVKETRSLIHVFNWIDLEHVIWLAMHAVNINRNQQEPNQKLPSIQFAPRRKWFTYSSAAIAANYFLTGRTIDATSRSAALSCNARPPRGRPCTCKPRAQALWK